MTFKYIEKSPNSLVRRTYRCDTCRIEWVEWVERGSVLPECAKCELEAVHKLGIPGVLTNKSRAVDFAQATAESMGLTDIADNQRPGDIAFKPDAPMATAERERLIRESIEAGMPAPLEPDKQVLADNFFAAQQAVNTGNQAMDMIVQNSIAMSGANAAVARNEGVDPVAMLHHDKTPMKLDVVSRADSDGNIIQRRRRGAK